jgi:hypothetical protein
MTPDGKGCQVCGHAAHHEKPWVCQEPIASDPTKKSKVCACPMCYCVVCDPDGYRA